MRRLRALFVRMRSQLRRDRLDRDLASELESHLAHHIDDNIRAGMTPDEARRHALAQLGGVTQVQERHRDARGIAMIDRLTNDVRYALRGLIRSPGFTAVAMLSLAFGIGANATIFSALNGLFFKPLPVERPERLVAIGRTPGFGTSSYPDFRDLRDRATALSGIAALRFSPINLEADNSARRIWGLLVSGNYFDMLGVRAARGRTLTPEDDRVPGRHPVVVLSDTLWRSAFAADPAVIGRTVKVNGMPFTVIGVAPRGFRGTERLFAPEVWIPVAMVGHVESGNDWLERRQTQNIFLLGRLRDGVSSVEAEAALNIVAAQIGREHPQPNEGLRYALVPPGLMGGLLRGPIAGFGGTLLAIAGLVLLLTCTNLAGLMLARSADRQRETAVRLALGARRSDLIRRALAEAAVISAGGAAAALLLAYWLSAALTAWRPPSELPIVFDVSFDHRVLAAGIALSVACTFLVGLLPALQGSRSDIIVALKSETTRWKSGWHARDAIVAVQVALSTILLVGSLLVVRSLQQSTRVDVGFTPEHAVSLSLDLGLEGYDQARGRIFQEAIVARLSAVPGVSAAATTSALPLTQDISTHGVHVEGQPVPRGTRAPSAMYYQVSPGLFRALGTRMVAGRDFTEFDTDDRPRLVIVNETFARRHFGGQALGKRFRTGAGGNWMEVIGVVQDGKYQTLGEDGKAVVFHSARQWYNPTTIVVARTSLDEQQALAAIRRIVLEMDPHMTIFSDAPLRRVLALPLLPTRAAAGLLVAFGVLAIVMVLVGTYGVTSYAVAQRSREISIRLAIGATAAQIVRLVLARAVWVWAAGVSVGVVGAVAGAPLLSPMLLGVAPRDPLVLFAAIAIIAGVTLVAVWPPSRRALNASPGSLLRDR